MPIDSVLEKDELFTVGDSEKIWKKYCGFLDLSLDEFMVIQKLLLAEQLELAINSELASKIMKGHKPKSVAEFRRDVPLTTYEDYLPYLSQEMAGALAKKPVLWAHTSGQTGTKKWVPYTKETLDRLANDTLAAFILSSATKKREVLLHEGVKVVLNLPPIPYITGVMAFTAAQRMPYDAIPPLEEAAKMQFEERIRQSFKTALCTEVDYAASIAVVLTKVGASFSQLGRSTSFSQPIWHPLALFRLLKAIVKSKLIKRPVLPRDLWRIKGIVCGGTDTAIYRDQINYYWGVQPLDIYVSTETGFIAMQGWNKKGMTFVPYSNFYEFIPEEEWLKSKDDKGYQPSTVLLDEVEEGKIYEIVVTNFHGGPFFRYRLGDLIKICSLKDDDAGVALPQMVFQSRADDIIDIAGFARLDEKTLWQAIQNTSISYVDWSACKGLHQGNPVLHLYIELSNNKLNRYDVEHLIDQQLMTVNEDYRDFRTMTGIQPLIVTLLNQGSFQKYQQNKQAAGFDLAHLKPPHISAHDAAMNDLLYLSQES